MSLIDVKNRVQCLLTEDITSTQTSLPVGPGSSDFLPAISHKTLAVIRDALGAEIVFVTEVEAGALTVERGRDGTAGRAFRKGAIVSLRLAKGSFDQFPQKTLRQVSYNPNKVLLPAYFGEKVLETGLDACQRRVWQNVKADSASWRVVYGNNCQSLENWRDWDWEEILIPWGEWPSPATDLCGWTMALYEFVEDPTKQLKQMHRACLAASAGEDVEYITDYSGTGNSLLVDTCTECLPVELSADVDSYYRFTTADLGIYYWGETWARSEVSATTTGKVRGNTCFFTAKLSLESGDAEQSIASFSLGSRVGVQIKADGTGSVYDSLQEAVSGYSVEFSGFQSDEWLVCCIRIDSSGNVVFRVNGTELSIGSISQTTDTEPEGYLYVHTESYGGVFNFDMKDLFWFKTSFSDEDVIFFEDALMAIHGIEA